MTAQKSTQTFDVMVLGAGIVGVSTAAHLRRLGLDVALIDRKHPGQEASAGNAGVIQHNGFLPFGLPKDPVGFLRSSFNLGGPFSYRPLTLIRMLPWIRKYIQSSYGEAAEAYCKAIMPLRALAVQSHLELAETSNAGRFYRKGGWLHLFRGQTSFDAGDLERYYARIYGVDYREMDGEAVKALEPGLTVSGKRAVHWTESRSVSNPAAVVEAFWRGYIRDGGQYFRADAKKTIRKRGGWSLEGERGPIFARHAVVCLGAWSMDVLKKFGERYPLAVKRGYHMHYRPLSGASISRPIVDIDNGFALTPTDFGIRLTTGVELAGRDAPPNPQIVKLVKRRAEEIIPLGRALQDEPWLGSRPCVPDSLPIIGPSPTIKGLWLNFAHGHDGFTLGPVSGRVIAELLIGKTPCADVSGVSPVRFQE
ncbi:NAD(P)/FAD-dependent oxidoreductase [Roseibium sp.]|uniref:NAD(P)/FAD-dependent oxidoreductase n=1 Tax=Roseibium sp. TaxID=1936156 RepID=UPI003B51A0BF